MVASTFIKETFYLREWPNHLKDLKTFVLILPAVKEIIEKVNGPSVSEHICVFFSFCA